MKDTEYYENLSASLRARAMERPNMRSSAQLKAAAEAIDELLDAAADPASGECPFDLSCVLLNRARRLAVDSADLFVNRMKDQPQREMVVIVHGRQED